MRCTDARRKCIPCKEEEMDGRKEQTQRADSFCGRQAVKACMVAKRILRELVYGKKAVYSRRVLSPLHVHMRGMDFGL